MIVIKWGGGGHTHTHTEVDEIGYIWRICLHLYLWHNLHNLRTCIFHNLLPTICLLRLGGLSINLLYNLFWSTVRIFSSQRGRKLQLEYWFDEGQPHHWKKLKLSLLPDFLQHIQSEANIRGTWEQKIFYCYGPNQYKLYEIFVKTKIMSVRDPWRMEYPISPVVSSLRYMPHDST